jgi:arylsulfatase A-like enzyme
MPYLISILYLFVIHFQSDELTTNVISSKPNIIYILMDDLGIEELQVYNAAAPIPTPNLSRLAAEGRTFTQHYAGTSVCAPSRCVLMTGRHTGHCEVRGNRQAQPTGQMPLSDSTVTVAELLKTAGYRTALMGKWGLGSEGTSGEPTRQGFDSYYGYLDQVLAHNAFPEYLVRNGNKEHLGNKVVWEGPEAMFKGMGSYTPKADQKVYANDLFTTEALNFIQNNQKNPFFLYLAYTIPHNNGEAPKADRFESPTLEPFADKDWTETEKCYAASLHRMDTYIGQILAKLEVTGLSKNTIVFFSSDNGSTEDISQRFTNHNKLRGFKRSPYEGGIRVPLLVWGKGRIPAGVTNNDLLGQWDFLPTACALAGVKLPKNIDGTPMNAIVKSKSKRSKPATAYWEFHEQGGWQAIREGNYKLIFKHKTQEYELYDIKNNPAESKNIIKENPDVAARLQQKMKAARTESAYFNFGKTK